MSEREQGRPGASHSEDPAPAESWFEGRAQRKERTNRKHAQPQGKAEVTQERIMRAAIRLSPHLISSLPMPSRHHDVISVARRTGWQGDVTDQGFITSTGRFVDRLEGWKIAEAAGQLQRLPGGVEGLLFTENLW